jgi:hypothetical protein
MANGPDGALYVLDMCRNLVESAAFMPSYLVKYLDVSGGVDKGRLYRIVPEGFRRPRTPRLSKATTAELVTLLEHPNGWHRDTASRLPYQRQDRSAVTPLQKLAVAGSSPLGRMQALHALDGLKVATRSSRRSSSRWPPVWSCRGAVQKAGHPHRSRYQAAAPSRPLAAHHFAMTFVRSWPCLLAAIFLGGLASSELSLLGFCDWAMLCRKASIKLAGRTS